MSERDPTDPNAPHDDPAIGALYRHARRGEPSADLDARILTAARRAARRRRNRWMVPLSTAATLLIGITLLLKAVDQGPYAPERAIGLDEPLSLPHSDAAGVPAPEREVQEAAPMLKSRPAPPVDRFDAPRALRGPAPLPEAMQDTAPPFEERAPGEPPAAWLADIERLFEAGETDRARAELKRFREHYPDHPLPEPLQVLEAQTAE